MIHELKIYKSFADAIISGDKTFEVRHNDRGFQKGDKVRFKVEDNSEKREDHPAEIRAKMENCLINYTFSGRGRDVLALAIEIAEKTAKKLEISYDDFCKMLKIRWNQEDSIVEKKFKNIFGDLFKD